MIKGSSRSFHDGMIRMNSAQATYLSQPYDFGITTLAAATMVGNTTAIGNTTISGNTTFSKKTICMIDVVVAVLPAFMRIDLKCCAIGELIGRGSSCLIHAVSLRFGIPGSLPPTVIEAAGQCYRMVIKIIQGRRRTLSLADDYRANSRAREGVPTGSVDPVWISQFARNQACCVHRHAHDHVRSSFSV
jgi:hypothetical protein